jgi:hypothetical protein
MLYQSVGLTIRLLIRRSTLQMAVTPYSWKSVKRHPVKHAIVHSLGTLRAPRNFDAPQSKAMVATVELSKPATEGRYDREAVGSKEFPI